MDLNRLQELLDKENARHAAVRAKRGLPPRAPRTVKEVLGMAKKYTVSTTEWVREGCPTRTDDEVAAIFAICIPCEHFQDGVCRVCSCKVNTGNAVVNKIRRATEHCPLDPPKW